MSLLCNLVCCGVAYNGCRWSVLICLRHINTDHLQPLYRPGWSQIIPVSAPEGWMGLMFALQVSCFLMAKYFYARARAHYWVHDIKALQVQWLINIISLLLLSTCLKKLVVCCRVCIFTHDNKLASPFCSQLMLPVIWDTMVLIWDYCNELIRLFDLFTSECM